MPDAAHIDEPAPVPTRALPWIVGLFVLGAAVCVAAMPFVSAPRYILAAAMLAVFAVITERIEVQLGELTVTGGFLPAVAVCVLSPQLAPLVGLIAVVGEYPSLRSRTANTAMSVLVCSGTAVVATPLLDGSTHFGDIVLAACVATLTFVALNAVLLALYVVNTGTATTRELVIQMIPSMFANTLFFTPIVGVFCAIVFVAGPWTIPALLVPLGMCQYFLSLYHGKVEMTAELAEKAQILARTNLQFAAAMVKALDQRDAYTAGHSAAVAVYTRDIAREMGFSDEVVRVAHLAGLLHDIGKIGVPGRVLNKTAPLDDDEYELMKSHAAMGAEILGEVDLYSDIALLVRYHHERIDGKGYPDRLEGEAIPAISRMISVADTYSAMTTDRPYRDGMPTEKAMTILRECRGTQLDQDFTDAFLRILVVASDEYQRGKQTDFEVEVAKHQALSEVEAEAIRVAAPALPPVPAGPAAVPVTTPAGDVIVVEVEREAA